MYYSVYVDGRLLFSTNNIPSNPYVIEAKLSMSDNAAGSLDLTVLPSCPVTINRMKSHILVQRDGNDIWEGRALSEDIDFFNRHTYHFEGELAYLLDSIQPKRKLTGVTVRGFLEDLIKVHNDRVDSNKRFVVGSVTAHSGEEVFNVEINYENTLSLITSILVDSDVTNRQGHLRVRRVNGERHLDYLGDYPTTNAQTIRFAENLLDFTQNFELSELATVIIPTGILVPLDTDDDPVDGSESSGDYSEEDSTLTIESVNGGSIYLESSELINLYGRVEKVVDFGEVESATELLNKGKEWFSSQQFDDVTIEVNVLDLHYLNPDIQAFNMLDRVHCVSAPHGMDRFFPVTAMEINLLQADDCTVTLNESNTEGISSSNVRTGEMIDARLKTLPSETRILDMAKRNATEIMNMATNGYVTIVTQGEGNQEHAAEIIISETIDWHDSQRLWKWNMNGFAYSKDGGKTWGLAITMDGAIVADFITAGVLSGDRIQGGTIRLGGLGGYRGLIEVYNENDILVGSWGVNGMNMVSGSKLNVAIEIDNGRFKAFRNGEETGYINGNQYITLKDKDGNVTREGYGTRIAGRNGIILRGPVMGASKDFVLDDEGGFYDAGGDGRLKVIHDIYMDNGDLKYTYTNVRFTNGLMTTDIENSYPSEGDPDNPVIPIPPQTVYQSDLEKSYAADMFDWHSGSIGDIIFSSGYDDEQRESIAVNCNDVRQSNTVNVGRIEGRIFYDVNSAQYKHGSVVLPDYPMISGSNALYNMGVGNNIGEWDAVYVGYYYDSWYVVGPIATKFRIDNESDAWQLESCDAVHGSWKKLISNGSSESNAWKQIGQGLFDLKTKPTYRTLPFDWDRPSSGYATAVASYCKALQFYWDSGKFYVQPGFAWNENAKDSSMSSKRPYINSYFVSSGFGGDNSYHAVSPICLTDVAPECIHRLAYNLTANRIYWFKNYNSVAFVNAVINANK